MIRRTLLLSFSALALVGCGELTQPAAAVVNGEKITFEEVEQGLQQFQSTERYKQLAEQGDVEAVTRQFEQGFLATLVRRAVLEPRAKELGVEVTEEDIQNQIDVIKAEFPSEQAFQEALKEQALDEAQLRELVRDRLLEEALRAKVTEGAGATEAEIAQYYEDHAEEFSETGVRHILVEDKALAERIVAQLRAARGAEVEELFARLAKKHSADPGSGAQGGDLGYAPAGQYVPPFEKAVETLEVGEISAPVKTQFGFHVIQVYDRRVTPLEVASADISQRLSGTAQDEAWAAWLEEAYAEAGVRVNSRYGELDVTTGQILDPSAETVPGAEAPSEAPPAEAPPGQPQPQG